MGQFGRINIHLEFVGDAEAWQLQARRWEVTSWSIREPPRDNSWEDKEQNPRQKSAIIIKYNTKHKITFNEYFL